MLQKSYSAEQFSAGEVLFIDKFPNWTSFDVVKKIRNLVRIKKVGHAGTLDPLATGLLIVCLGKMTKQIEQYQAQKKVYSGSFTLGSTTPSFDLETEINQQFPTAHITEELIRKTTKNFIGETEQYPPVYSALKKDGKRLYEFARAGKDVAIEARKITIDVFDITAIRGLEVDFEVECNKGTYIRSLADNFG
ncbi:MAG: tRNA pseudouridine(55) synthase TruB, partial [Bacteroidales bacterium]|nr:tRNA pseudouridine(55) synthase TruB [Bacteroidales bacterium]